jgi:hypothetical protein
MSEGRRESSGAQGGDGIVQLDGEQEGLSWIRPALWIWLLSWVGTSLATFYMRAQIEIGVDPAPFELFRAIQLASMLADLIAGVAMALGLVQFGRSPGTRGLRAMAGLAAGAVAITAAQLLFELYAQVRGRWFESQLTDFLLWGWLIRAALWPVVVTCIVAIFCRVARQPGHRAVALISCAGAAALAQAIFYWLSAFGADVVIAVVPETAINLGLAVAAFACAFIAAGPARRPGPIPDETLAPSSGWARAASGLSLVGATMTVRLILSLLVAVLVLPGPALGSDLAPSVVIFAGLFTSIPVLVAMVVGVRRLFAAPEPATARSATGASLILLLAALLLQTYAAMLANGPFPREPGESWETDPLIAGLIVVAGLLEVAGLAVLLRGTSALAARIGERRAARDAAWLATVLVVIMGVGALARYRYHVSWGEPPVAIIVLLASIATLWVVARFAALARQVGRDVLKASVDGPALARAVAVVRDEQ